MNGWSYLSIGIVSVLIGNATIKYSHGFEKLGWGIIALSMLLLCNICFGMAVKTLPLSIAYAVWMGFVSVGVVLVSHFFFNEKIIGVAGILMLIIMACSIALIYVSKAGQPT